MGYNAPLPRPPLQPVPIFSGCAGPCEGGRLTEAELARLYEQYGYLVHRRCLQILRSQAEADDAVQEVFMRVLRYHQNQGVRSMLGWLYGIAANVCFDLLDRRARHAPEERADAAADARFQGGSGDADRRALVGAVLRGFDARTREVGVRHFLDGMTQEEVAAHTGYSRRTVGKKLRVFEERFRQLFSSVGGQR